GTVLASDAEAGLFVSLGFFDDVMVPVDLLPKDAEYKPLEGVWTVRPEGAEDEDDTIYFDDQGKVTFRVVK
ncbi:hypothetical protein KIPB_013573, partial [Kipferlia bialata]